MRRSKLYFSLKSHRRKKDRLMFFSVVLLALALLITASAAAFLTFSAWFYLLLLIPAGLALRYYFTRPDLYKVAKGIEGVDPSWIDRLSTAVDLSAKDNPREVYSQELTSQYIEKIETRLVTHRLTSGKKKLLFVSLSTLAASTLLGIIFGLLFMPRMDFGARFLFAPHTLDLHIEALSTDTLVDLNDRVEITALVRAPIELKYVYLIAGLGNIDERYRVAVEGDTARFTIIIDEEQTLRFTRFGVFSDDIYLGLQQPFEILNISLVIIPPAYTREKPQRSAGFVLRALPGSKIVIEGQASAMLGNASLRIDDSTLSLNQEKKKFSGSFQFDDPEQKLSLSLTSRSGTKLIQEIVTESRKDETPLVEVFMPGRDSDVSSAMELALGIHVLDDYGLGQVRLIAKGSSRQNLVIARSGGKSEDTIFYRWNIGDLGMLPGDQIEYYVQASDNDDFSGPKWGSS